MIGTGFLKPDDNVVLFNTGSGNKYTDVLAEAFGLLKTAEPQSTPSMAHV